jgi:hypothetical protein
MLIAIGERNSFVILPLWKKPRVVSIFMSPLYSARNYRPCFRENQPKRSFSIKWKRAFWARFRENWVYKFGHSWLNAIAIDQKIALSRIWDREKLKGTVPKDFFTFLQVFFKNSFPPSIQLGSFQKISKFRGNKCTTSVVDTGGKWKKISIRKAWSILFGHLWVVELI